MTSLQNIGEFDCPPESPPAEARSVWSRWLSRIIGSSRRPARWSRAERVPVYRIARTSEDRWIVERPGGAMEHAFPDLEQAVAFVRHECRYQPATVELRVDDLYVVAQLDPNKPTSLFGEALS
jgi:hypothetical protein